MTPEALRAALAMAERDMASWLLREHRQGGLPRDLLDKLLAVMRAPTTEATALLAELYRPAEDVPEHLRPAVDWWQDLIDALWALVEIRAEAESLE